MTNFIPIFPLGVVVYPRENLNLHIFEPRYRQLISECVAHKKPFGIPTVIDNEVMEFGTLIEVSAVKKTYDDGKMDISTLGLSIFRTLEVVKKVPDKMYSGAIVTYPDYDADTLSTHILPVATAIRQLHGMLGVEKPFPVPDDQLVSYHLAHLAGMSLQEAYEMLQLLREDQRVEYLKRHLQKVVPVVSEIEALKQRIRMNGHFRELKSLGFE